MKLGTGLFTCQQRPDDNRSTSEIYDEMLKLGRTIDNTGLDSAWVSEHHFLKDDYLSGVVPSLGALAAVTDNIEIGSCIALAPLYDPVRLAEDIATIDQISEGRATLGLAIGSNDDEFDAFGIPPEERTNRLIDTVNVIRGAWSDGPIDYRSSFIDISPNVDVRPKPAHDVPIMLGGAARPAVQRASQLGDAWCAPSSLSINGIRKRIEHIENSRESENMDSEFQVYVLQHGFVGDSREDAWKQMRDGYFYIQRRYEEIFTGKRVEELSTNRKEELKDQAIFGNPEQVVEELNKYRKALGDNIHFIFRIYHPGIGTERMDECIRRLGNKVRPHLV